MAPNRLKSLILAVVAVLSLNAAAESVEADAALAVASRFATTHWAARKSPANVILQLAHTEVATGDVGVADFYIFNAMDHDGFVIVSGDDRARSILAYGDGAFDIDNIPDNLRWMLDEYKSQMAVLRAHPEVKAPKDNPSDDNLIIQPMITRTWHQGEPYWNQCPTYNGIHCYTGCVATATAMVCDYWKFPTVFPALPGYVTFWYHISVPSLPPTTINWDNMLDNYAAGEYNEAQANAVATLMRYCGQACYMDYGDSIAGGSGASIDDEITALKLFGFNPEFKVPSRDRYDLQQWEDMLHAELSTGRPILYGGYNGRNRHLFVVDGCQGNMFHINWGWGGNMNGFFSMDIADTDVLPYNRNQYMFYQLYPAEENTTLPVYDFQKDGIYYIVNGSEATVTCGSDIPNSYAGSVFIPENVEYQGSILTVTAIGDLAFCNNSALTEVRLPKTIRSIGKYAFSYCNGLNEITLGDQVTEIGELAFSYCANLNTILLGSNVGSIGEMAFVGCSKLATVNITDLAAWCSIDFQDTSSNPLANGALMTYNGEEMREVTIPETISSIGRFAFYKYQYLTRLTISNSITNIGMGAFTMCNNLTDVTFGEHVTTIGENAFQYCIGLKNITIPESVKEIDKEAFYWCNHLTDINLGNVEVIGNGAFSKCTALTRISIPATTTAIGADAFYGCTGLERVDISDIRPWCNISFGNINANPVSITQHLFLNDEEVTELVIPDHVTAISDYAFYNCQGLTSITMSNSVERIGNQAFSNCGNLAVATLGENVTRIGESAFSNCTALTHISIPASMTGIGIDAFNGCTGLERVDISDIGAWCNISFGNIDANPVSITQHLFMNDEEVQELNIPDHVTIIRNYAFYNCKGLTSITLGNSVTRIGDQAFSNCNKLRVVILGDNVRTIGEKAFSGCSLLSTVTLGKQLESIKSMAFSSCIAIKNITCRATIPPTIADKACFANGIYNRATVNVPTSALESYKTADYWKEFTKLNGIIIDPVLGDVNLDGEVTVADINLLIDCIIRQDFQGATFDVNQDGEINIGDINTIIDIILNE